VFDVYDPELGAPIGGGGRYDDLLGRFGRSLPAVGFALGVDRLHIALAGEERGTGALLARPDGDPSGRAGAAVLSPQSSTDGRAPGAGEQAPAGTGPPR
jgi:ATP phosphoribosyltransferase regulatory subunit